MINMNLLKEEIVNKLKEIEKTLKKLNKDLPVHKITINDLLEVNLNLTEWDLRKLGGLTALKARFLPEEDKDLAEIHETRSHNSYVRSLENKLGEKESFERKALEVLCSTIEPLPKIKPPKRLKVTKKKLDREVVAMLNDTHVGCIVDSEEINGLNSFDFKEAGRRFAYYVQEVANYKPHVRSEVNKLHLVLNGDLIAGVIHGLDTKGIHLLVHQVNGLMHILTHAINHLAQSYNKIEVLGIAGNHDRSVHKNHGQRAVSEVYDSYVNWVFYGLSTAFRNSSQISFNFPKTPYGFLNLPGGRAMVAHGDHIFSKAMGNIGTSINVKGLSSAIKNFNAGEIAQGRSPIKLLLLGHVHVYAHFITDDGVEVYISPSLSGTDSYAHSLTINTSFVAQPVFESTPKFILGDSRLIRVGEADNLREMDNIIPEYKKELKWSK